MFDPKILNEVYVNLLQFFTFPSLKPKQFGGIAHVSGFKSEWHKNFYVSYDNMQVFVTPKS